MEPLLIRSAIQSVKPLTHGGTGESITGRLVNKARKLCVMLPDPTIRMPLARNSAIALPSA